MLYKRQSIMIDDVRKEQIKIIAVNEDVSFSEIIRLAIDNFMGDNFKHERDRRLRN